MNGFLDLVADSIVDARTRRYFHEILKLYATESYRSLLPSLWSVVITDLLFKLEEASSVYGDKAAATILKEIDAEQKKNPKSPAWEEMLIEKVEKSTKLFSLGDYNSLKHLQQQRHLCAHPVLGTTEALFTPTREECLAHIRTAVDAVLTKPALLSQKVFDAFIEDVATVSATLTTKADLKKYVTTKYLAKLPRDTTNLVFRSFWKVAFKAADAKAKLHRKAVRRTVEIFLEERAADLLPYIQQHNAAFSDIAADADDQLLHLIHVLALFPKVYAKLNDAVKTQIESACNATPDLELLAWFRSASMDEHVKAYIEGMSSTYTKRPKVSGVLRFATIMAQHGRRDLWHDVAIESYGRSGSYDAADDRFTRLIEPIMDELNVEQVKRLFELIEGNQDCYGRRRAIRDHQKLMEAVQPKLPGDFKYSKFPHLEDLVKPDDEPEPEPSDA